MTISNLFSYFSLLLNVKIIRTVYSLKFLILRYTGGMIVSTIRPFETKFIDSKRSKRRIRVDIYRNTAALKPDAGPIAVHLNWHGSGFVMTNFGENKPFVEHVLKHEALTSYPLAIIDCDYAKGPEHPCPAATDDARDVLDYVLRNPSIYDPKRITLGGFSSGGCIALGLSAKIGAEVRESVWPYPKSDYSRHPIQAVITYYPVTNWEQNRLVPTIPEGTTFPGVLLPKHITDAFDAGYFSPPTLDISPSSQNDLQRVQNLQRQSLLNPSEADSKDFPDTIAIVTAEYDTFTHDDEKFREKLKGQGKKVYGRMVPKVGHAWDLVVTQGQDGYEERVEVYDMAAKMIAQAGESKSLVD